MDSNDRNSFHHPELHPFNQRRMGLEFQTVYPQEKRRGSVECLSRMVPVIAKEGFDGLPGKACDDCSPTSS
jgi:hypothetical protein